MSEEPKNTWAIAISVSIHDGSENQTPNRTVHFVSPNDRLLSQDIAEHASGVLAALIELLGVGVYRIEAPRTGEIIYDATQASATVQ